MVKPVQAELAEEEILAPEQERLTQAVAVEHLRLVVQEPDSLVLVAQAL
jgi:hypothetical protein